MEVLDGKEVVLEVHLVDKEGSQLEVFDLYLVAFLFRPFVLLAAFLVADNLHIGCSQVDIVLEDLLVLQDQEVGLQAHLVSYEEAFFLAEDTYVEEHLGPLEVALLVLGKACLVEDLVVVDLEEVGNLLQVVQYEGRKICFGSSTPSRYFYHLCFHLGSFRCYLQVVVVVDALVVVVHVPH